MDYSLQEFSFSLRRMLIAFTALSTSGAAFSKLTSHLTDDCRNFLNVLVCYMYVVVAAANPFSHAMLLQCTSEIRDI